MSFFRTALYIAMGMILFNVIIGWIFSTGAFPLEGNPGMELTEDNALNKLTGLTGGMEYIWLAGTTLSALASIGLAILLRVITPIGIWMFGEVFWTSWIRTNSVLSMGGFLPDEFLAIFFIGMMFLFIAVIIGMLVGRP